MNTHTKNNGLASAQRQRCFRIPGAFDRLLDSCQSVLRLSRALHLTSADSASRQRTLIVELCRLVSAECGRITIRETQIATGRQGIVSTVDAGLRISSGVHEMNGEAEEAEPPTGACHETFLSIAGVRLVACLTIFRVGSGQRFTPGERALVDLIHRECAWIYDPRPTNGDARPMPSD